MALEIEKQRDRDPGKITIFWDPNTGQVGYQAGGMNPMEELGVLETAAQLRRNEIMGAGRQARVELAPGPMPAGRS